jgi:ubiquinone/menaquinone biosynthesis C-methylase UbiE
MGYVFDFKDATDYEKWFFSSRNRIAADLETRLTLSMLKPVRGRSLLDVGCGTGARLSPLLKGGLDVSGLDPSPYMLDIAGKKLGNRVELHRGLGESLPFEDNSFHYVSLITTLEYVDDPVKALEEALRVAKDKIFIGIYNRHAIKCLQHRVRGMFVETIFSRARFYTIWEVKQMIGKVVGEAPVAWKTVCQFPGFIERYLYAAEHYGWVQKSPFGAFAGITVMPVPRFRTTPLTLMVNAKRGAAQSIQPMKTTDRQ